MDAYEALTTRATPLELGDPAPTHAELSGVLAAALRAPDHGRLRPWRFLSISGESRLRLGELFASSLQHRDPRASAENLERERQKALRAPLIIVAIAAIKANPKIPAVEQLLSAGAAVQNILVACHARGFGASWKTGDAAYDPKVKEALGLRGTEEIVGFLYIGTPKAMPRPTAPLDPAGFLEAWPAA
jgi:nitroreductase